MPVHATLRPPSLPMHGPAPPPLTSCYCCLPHGGQGDQCVVAVHHRLSCCACCCCCCVSQGDQRIVTVKEGEPKGRHVIIIDDLVQSGGTLLQCGQRLKELGANCVSAYATHGVFPKESWRKFCEGGANCTFKYFFITDSCQRSAQAVEGKGPFQVISLAPSIARALLV